MHPKPLEGPIKQGPGPTCIRPASTECGGRRKRLSNQRPGDAAPTLGEALTALQALEHPVHLLLSEGTACRSLSLATYLTQKML